jgi:hypothetical protein
VDGGMLRRNGCDGKVLRCGAGNRHQHLGPPCERQQPLKCDSPGAAIVISSTLRVTRTVCKQCAVATYSVVGGWWGMSVSFIQVRPLTRVGPEEAN